MKIKRNVYKEFFNYHNYNSRFTNIGELQSHSNKLKLHFCVAVKRFLSILSYGKSLYYLDILKVVDGGC
jgi:hypothetical protein